MNRDITRKYALYSKLLFAPAARLLILCVLLYASTMPLRAQHFHNSDDGEAYHAGFLLVKFRAQSETLRDWQAARRQGVISRLQSALGKHRSEALFDDGLVQSVNEIFLQRTENNPLRYGESLERWCKIYYESELDAAYLAIKVRQLPDVEHAEPLYKRSLTNIPNDPFVSSQSYLNIVRAFDAWNALAASNDTSTAVVIAVIDSGVDYDHQDLAANIHINPGESGFDAQGRDKRFNGIDDDGNGRIDDWRGWDFTAGADGASEDNDPKPPRNNHGTHVAGIAGAVTNNGVGVAGAARNIRILPVKCSPDGVTNDVLNGFRGIIYAATMRAGVINCSWGALSRSQAEQEAIDIAVSLGAIVVAAAGNDGRYTPFYPASYHNVCSVAWLENNDVHISGNFHETVKIGAPGTNIFSTFVENRYGSLSGTSMATPLVSAAAALVKMKFPNLSPAQIITRLKASADNNDRLNPRVAGLIGAGRLNMLRAVQTAPLPFLEIQNVAITDENGNGILESGERVQIRLHLKNGETPLTPIARLRTTLESNSRFLPFWDDTVKTISAMSPNETRPNAVTFSLRLTAETPQNFLIPLLFFFTDAASGESVGRGSVTLTANPSYRTLRGNNVFATLNSRGGIGFNDFPVNMQGDGVIYRLRDTNNLLYEGGLIVAASPDSVSSAVRETPSRRDQAFVSTSLLSLKYDADSSALSATTAFTDLGASGQAGVSVEQTAVQYRTRGQENLLISSYIITNASSRFIPRLHVGLFFDWDIGNYEHNETFWDVECQCAIARAQTGGFPVVGVKLLSPQKPSFFPLILGDTAQGSITLNSGFSRAEKHRTLANGIQTERKTGDIAHVVGASDIELAPGASVMVKFSIALGLNAAEVRETFRSFTAAADSFLATLYPNPVSGDNVFFEYALSEDQFVVVELLNGLGQLLQRPVHARQAKGRRQVSFRLDGLPNGVYFVRLQAETLVGGKTFIIAR
jgi:hypothetical protein